MMRRDTLMISLLLYTGVRKGEFISLQIKDIDLYKKLITIRGETSKSKKTRELPIHPTLLFHLRDYLEERRSLGYKSEFLIISLTGDRGLSREGLKHWVNRMIEISGVKFHLHQFRHTFACKLTEAGVPTASLQKLMGHTDIKMTAKYTRSLKAEDMGVEIDKISL
jgi:integrase